MQSIRWHAGLLALATFSVLTAPAAEDKVEVKIAKYADLTATVQKLKGKVIVVDFWADW
jgi:thiol:disulfide interchange protein